MKMDIVGKDLEAWQARAPELDVAGRQIIWRIQVASRYIEQAYATLDDGASRVSPSGAKLLIYLATLPAPHQISPKEMGELLDLTSGSVTSLIDRLEAHGYVARHPDPDDRRGVLVRLSPEGLNAGRQLQKVYRAFEAEFLAPLDGDERDTLVRLFSKLLSAYESNAEREQTIP